jgi:hypothetical protein
MPRGSRRSVLPSFAAIGIVLLRGETARAAGARLLVFVQTAVTQRAFQSMLQSALPDLSVTAVGRIADFDRAIEEGQDAVLTLPVVMEAHGMTPVIRGRRGGEVDEPYSLVGVDVPPQASTVKTVGALAILDRDGTTKFVRDLVGPQVKVERVTKIEDLLPLLQMQRVDAVLMPSRLFSEIKSTSALNLAERELATRIGLPAIASLGPAGGRAVDRAAKLSGGPARVMGVDSWQ